FQPPSSQRCIALGIGVDDILRDQQMTTMGIYVIKVEGGDIGVYTDVGIVIDGVIILDNLNTVAIACAMMLGLIYALNLQYPKELKYYYEFVQKLLMQIDAKRLSPKVLGLKNKICAIL
uniref:Si:ch211-155o21.3 n=1 Tax=Erpetoichthys calabaricus TaxID=27687 RepID=A0A8C4ST76_ERPCA